MPKDKVFFVPNRLFYDGIPTIELDPFIKKYFRLGRARELTFVRPEAGFDSNLGPASPPDPIRYQLKNLGRFKKDIERLSLGYMQTRRDAEFTRVEKGNFSLDLLAKKQPDGSVLLSFRPEDAPTISSMAPSVLAYALLGSAKSLREMRIGESLDIFLTVSKGDASPQDRKVHTDKEGLNSFDPRDRLNFLPLHGSPTAIYASDDPATLLSDARHGEVVSGYMSKLWHAGDKPEVKSEVASSSRFNLREKIKMCRGAYLGSNRAFVRCAVRHDRASTLNGQGAWQALATISSRSLQGMSAGR